MKYIRFYFFNFIIMSLFKDDIDFLLNSRIIDLSLDIFNYNNSITLNIINFVIIINQIQKSIQIKNDGSYVICSLNIHLTSCPSE